jgi:hypothetical protein
MAAQLRTNLHKRGPSLHGSVSVFCSILDRAIAPVGTLSLVLGVVASISGIKALADHLIATGVLFHLIPHLTDWLSTSVDSRRIRHSQVPFRP